MTFSLTLGLIFIIGSLFTFLVRKNLQKLVIISIPLIGVYNLFYSVGASNILFLTGTLNLMNVDTLSVLFASLFIFVALISFIYALTQQNNLNI